MKARRSFTVKILFESSRQPFSFSINLRLLLGAFVSILVLTAGFVILSSMDIGEEQIAEQQRMIADNRANIDAVTAAIGLVQSAELAFGEEIAPLMDRVLPASGEGASSTAAPGNRETDDLFGELHVDPSSLPDTLARLSRELSASSAVLTNLRTEQELLVQLLHEIPNAWPVGGNGGIVSMEFGPNIHPIVSQWYLHKGLDISAAEGTPILASANGTVTQIGFDPTYGNQVIVRHRYGFATRYPHLSVISVREGQRIAQGDVIGAMGHTGVATGTHLHFEVMLGDEVLDPAPFLKISNTFRRGGYGTR